MKCSEIIICRTKLIVIILSLVFCLPIFARTKIQGIVEQGGQVIITSSMQSTTKSVRTFPGSTVTVYVGGTLTLATTYSNSTGTIKPNPFTAGTDASWFVFVDPGVYDVKFSGTGISSPFTLSSITVGLSGASVNEISQMATGGAGTLLSPWTGWETAVNALPASSNMSAIAGFYSQTTLITLKQGDILQGSGKSLSTGSIFISAIAGSAFRTAFPLPGLTQANVSIRDISIQNTNALNTGSGFLETGGAFVELTNVSVQGFRYGMSFVGTESWRVVGANLQFQLRGGVWIVDGSDYQPPYADINLSANSNFTTNVGLFLDCQFNQNTGVMGVIDDGGDTHTFINCNFNGGTHAMVITAAAALKVQDCQFEASTGDVLLFTLATFNSGTGLGPSGTFSMDTCLVFAQTVGTHAITLGSSSLVNLLLNNTNMTSTVAAIFGASTITRLINLNSINSGIGTLYDANPIHLIELGSNITLANAPIVMTSRSGENTLSGGAIIVSCSTCTTNTLVLYSRKTVGGTVGNMSYTVSAGASFTLSSTSGTDTSTFAWALVEKQ